MKTKRLVLALLLALIISGVFTFWLSRRVAKAARINTPQKLLYVATKTALEAGDSLKRDNLELIEWHGSTPLADGLTKIDDLNGRVVLYPLAKGELIFERQLAAAGSGSGLTASIPPGMRAISVRSDEVVGVAGFLLPGTHVDVLLTYHSDKSPDPRTTTVLQNAVVLAAGQQIHPDAEMKPTSVSVVTLLLNPQDAEKLVLATSLGAIHFVLRNGGDKAQSTSPSVGLDQLAGTSSSPIPVVPVRTFQSKPKLRQYEVVTILGDKRVVSTFN